MKFAKENFNVQKRLVIITVILFFIKATAWFYTHSVAIFTDMVEYTINVVAGFISLYGLYLSARPRDFNHPYGHGKAEFVSAAIEGILMILSCFMIGYEAVKHYFNPSPLNSLDIGIYLVALTAIVNFIAGMYAVKKGKANNNFTLVAAGKHMQSDTYGTLGLIIGLGILYFTGIAWIDSMISAVFAVIILAAGYRVLKTSLAGIMDEADDELLKTVVAYLDKHRSPNWIDVHNLRIIKYGSVLHLDCHLTIPWYFNINQGHEEVKNLEDMVKRNFGEHVELFVHTDGCIPISCGICTRAECEARLHNNDKVVGWTVENVSQNSKHSLNL